MERLLETGDIVILPRTAVRKTGDEDPVDYYFRPLTAWLYRGRLRLAAGLLEPDRVASLLEVGYGSGIFLPELARHAERVTGIEVHDEAPRIGSMLRRFGVEVELIRVPLFGMPFPDGAFDELVCLSVLEHLTDLDRAVHELRRVLKPSGVAVLGFPVRNLATDGFFRLAGYDACDLHPSDHGDILRAFERHPGFRLELLRRMPRLLPLPVAAYVVCRYRAV